MKTVNDSKSVLSEVMLPSQANPAGTVHGGEIMKLMDACGGVAAMRHAKTNVVTVRVDELVFYQPILVGQLVICEAELAFVGKTSMEMKVTVKVEDLMSDVSTKLALTAYFTYVALDKKENHARCLNLFWRQKSKERLSNTVKKDILNIRQKIRKIHNN